ncbi:MAG: hypothetical protein ACKV2U_08455 [Bryobacteraceae bacterium]
MTQRFNSWLLVLFAAAGAAAIYGVLVLNRLGGDPPLADVLMRLPDKNAVTIHVDLAAIRKAGMAELLEGSAVAEEPDYRRFVTESGFDWKTDLEAITASKTGKDWFFFVRGRFDMEKLRNYALSRGGTCRNGVCDVMGETPGRRVSFYPMSPRMLVLASSNTPTAVYGVYEKNKPEWVGGVPEGPAWVSFNGNVLAGDPALPSGGRLFGKVLAETRRTTFSIGNVGGAMELKMQAHSADTAGAGNIKAQLEGVTAEFKKYFERLGQAASSGDLSGLLLSGQFAVAGNEVTGRWPLHADLLKKLAGGAL